MKLIFMVTVFLISLPSAAQYKDLSPGEYYNDDMITDKPKRPLPQMEVAPEKPMLLAPAKPMPRYKRPPVRRKPASLFEEVKPSRHVGDFEDVTNGAYPRGPGPANK